MPLYDVQVQVNVIRTIRVNAASEGRAADEGIAGKGHPVTESGEVVRVLAVTEVDRG